MGIFFEHTRNPQGLGGKLMVAMMNVGHRPVARWGMGHLNLSDGVHILDVGCGGGANLAALRKQFAGGQVVGLDHSPVSVEKAARINRKAIASGLCQVVEGDVSSLPFPENRFHQVTAFETVYFWPDLQQAFREVLRVLRPGGRFLICNESDGLSPIQETWCSIISGMTIYTAAQLADALEAAGFREIQIAALPRRRWLCVMAGKAVTPPKGACCKTEHFCHSEPQGVEESFLRGQM